MLAIGFALQWGDRQDDDESGATIFGEFSEESSAVRLDDLAADKKAQTETRAVVSVVGSVKWLEKQLTLLDGDT